MSAGGGKTKSKSEPVTWQKMMTPWQQQGMKQTAGGMIGRGEQGLAGIGLTPQQREGQFGRLSDMVSARTGAQTIGLNRRAAGQGLTGGALEEARAGIGAGGNQLFAQGLRSIEDMNMQLANQKIADFLSWMQWHPPQGQRSEGSGWQAQAKIM